MNFFLAEVTGVIVPFLSDFLRQHHWRYDEVGLAVAMGGVLGPLLQGLLTQHLGFPITFIIFAGIATLGALIFLFKMPETYQPGR